MLNLRASLAWLANNNNPKFDAIMFASNLLVVVAVLLIQPALNLLNVIRNWSLSTNTDDWKRTIDVLNATPLQGGLFLIALAGCANCLDLFFTVLSH